jgi:hypothetical protein
MPHSSGTDETGGRSTTCRVRAPLSCESCESRANNEIGFTRNALSDDFAKTHLSREAILWAVLPMSQTCRDLLENLVDEGLTNECIGNLFLRHPVRAGIH